MWVSYRRRECRFILRPSILGKGAPLFQKYTYVMLKLLSMLAFNIYMWYSNSTWAGYICVSLVRFSYWPFDVGTHPLFEAHCLTLQMRLRLVLWYAHVTHGAGHEVSTLALPALCNERKYIINCIIHSTQFYIHLYILFRVWIIIYVRQLLAGIAI